MGRRIRSVDTAGNVTTAFYDVSGNLLRLEELTAQGSADGTYRITEFGYAALSFKG